MEKECTKCNVNKESDCFRVRFDRRSNLKYLNSHCKECEKQDAKKRYNAVKDVPEFKIFNCERAKKYRIENPELFREQQQVKRQKESYKKNRVVYVKKNRAKILEQEKVTKKRYWQKQKENLTDEYVKVMITQRTPISRNEVPPELIKLKRLELICKRTLKTKI